MLLLLGWVSFTSLPFFLVLPVKRKDKNERKMGRNLIVVGDGIVSLGTYIFVL